MRNLIFLTICCLVTLLPFSVFAEGGSSGNGGGGGLTKEIDGNLQVITIDRWETQFRAPLVPMHSNEAPVQYLKRVLEQKIRPIDAFLVLRLEEALDQVLKCNWVNDPNLKLIDDTGEIKGNFKKAGWKRAQIIVRQSKSEAGRRPDITIYYNKSLFDRLDKFDVALLLLHEAVYVLATELEHHDSYDVRKLVTRLLAQNTLGIKDESGKLRDRRELTKEFREDLRDLGFARFTHLFTDEIKEAVRTNTASKKQIAYASFLTMNPFPFMTRFWDAPVWLTDEQSFYLYWYLYGGPGELWNNKYQGRILSLEEYVASPDAEVEQVSRVCGTMQFPQHPKLKQHDQNKAERYCKKYFN